MIHKQKHIFFSQCPSCLGYRTLAKGKKMRTVDPLRDSSDSFQRCPCHYVVPEAMGVEGCLMKNKISDFQHSEQIFNTKVFFPKLNIVAITL